jgi:hypothetical protein
VRCTRRPVVDPRWRPMRPALAAALLVVSSAAAATCDTGAAYEALMRQLAAHRAALARYEAQPGCHSDTERFARAVRGKSRGDAIVGGLRAFAEARAGASTAAACGPLAAARQAAAEDLADLDALVRRCPRPAAR